MKKVDIIKLRLKGVPTDEIKQLMELETLAEDAEQEDDEDDPPEEDDNIPPPPEDDNDEGNDKVTPETNELKKALEEARAQILELQKKKVREDISGADDSKDDQDIFNDCVRSFM